MIQAFTNAPSIRPEAQVAPRHVFGLIQSKQVKYGRTHVTQGTAITKGAVTVRIYHHQRYWVCRVCGVGAATFSIDHDFAIPMIGRD
jgi:hypothetical protein